MMRLWQQGYWKACDASMPVVSMGLQYGCGLFETLAVRKGLILDWQAHARRLTRSLHCLTEALPMSAPVGDAASVASLPSVSAFMSRLDIEMSHAVEALEARSCVLKVLVWYADAAWQYALLLRPWPYSAAYTATGIDLMNAQTVRASTLFTTRHKSLNYLDLLLIRQQAQRMGYGDAYLLNEWGRVTETTSASLFVRLDGVWRTPPLEEGLLAGTMRDKVLSLLPSEGFPEFSMREEALTAEALAHADAAFVTNALLGVCPVRRLDQRMLQNESTLYARLNGLLDRIPESFTVEALSR